jgi:S1-C subfamily serine protease
LIGAIVAVVLTLGVQSLSEHGNAPQVPLGNPNRLTVTDDTAVATVAQKAGPAVVSVLSQDPAAAGASGFLVSPDGYVVTNVGVVAGAQRLMVQIGNQAKVRDARLVDYDCQTGLAVVKVDQVSNLPTLSFGDSSSVQPGQTAVMLAGAQPNRSSVARATISSTGRDLTVNGLAPGAGDVQLSGLIDTDVTFGPVFDGGPMLNGGGQVVGVLAEATAGGQPAEFALPSNSVQSEVQEVVGGGKLVVPSLGVRSVQVSADQAALQGGTAGSRITSLTAGGPADRAGLKPGDVITKLDDTTINQSNPLPEVVRAKFKTGQRVTVSYVRGGQAAQVSLALVGEHPSCD